MCVCRLSTGVVKISVKILALRVYGERVSQAVVITGKEKGPPPKLDLDLSSEELEKRLRECLASRGRKATDPKVRT